jgi:hypothetical protein
MAAQNMRKTALYLDWDSVTRVRAVMKRLPGNLSLSSLISEQLPNMADVLEKMATAYESQNMDTVAEVISDLVDTAHTHAGQIRKEVRSAKTTPPKGPVLDVPPSKIKRQKKSV